MLQVTDVSSTSTAIHRVLKIHRSVPTQQAYKTIPEEHRKKVIRKSFWVALRRCVVHVVPITVSCTIMYLNLRGHFIGASFSSAIHSETINLLLLQIAAKVQELFIVASLTTIIFQVARHELLRGEGLPLGLLGSGILFSNFGYFFTREFIGSLSYDAKFQRKARYLAVLILAGLTAALAGPSSAVLLVPNKQDVSGGGTSFYMNGTFDDFWPINLDDQYTRAISYCVQENGSYYATCPSGGFKSLWEHFGQAKFANFEKDTAARPYAKALSGSTFYWDIDSPLSLVPKLYTLGSPHTNDPSLSNTFLIQAHAATTVMTQKVMTDWWATLLAQTRRSTDSIDDRVGQSNSINPYTQVRCSGPQNITARTTIVDFVTYSPPSIWGAPAPLVVHSLSNTSAEHPRFQWVHLPDSFGPTTIGAVFESPWTADNNSRVVIGCTLQSNWVNATLFTDEYSFWTGWYPWNIDFLKPYPPWTPPSAGESLSPTNGRIAVSDNWLAMLTPPIPVDMPGYSSWDLSTMESILINAGFSESIVPTAGSTMAQEWLEGDSNGISRTGLLEAIICSVFGDGLSRSGSYRLYDTSGDPSEWNLTSYIQKPDFDTRILKRQDALNPPNNGKGFVQLRVDMSISGYAYNASLAEYLAMVVLLVHMLFAIIHTAWMLGGQKTSDSWDSISKLLTLAQNSQPAFEALKNTGAGIDHLSTYSCMGQVRVTDDPVQVDCEHVELIFNKTQKSEQQMHEIRKHDDPEHTLNQNDMLMSKAIASSKTLKSSLRSNERSYAGQLDGEEELHQHRTPATWPILRTSSYWNTFEGESLETLRRQDSVASLNGSDTALVEGIVERRVVVEEEYS